jgi:hypothetical protein
MSIPSYDFRELYGDRRSATGQATPRSHRTWNSTKMEALNDAFVKLRT